MKKWLLVPLLLLPVAAVSEPIDPNPDGIGIYADVDGLVNNVDVHVGTPMEVYVLVTRPSGTRKLAGVEFSIVLPDNITIWGWNYPMPGAMVLGDPPNFMMAFDPVEYQSVNHVMTFIVVPTSSAPAQFYLGHFPQSEDVTAPRYLDVDYDVDPMDSELIDLTPYPGGCENMCFVINGDIVPDEVTSWSDVKALYR